jgi:mono/diheme cytochrome c family protein
MPLRDASPATPSSHRRWRLRNNALWILAAALGAAALALGACGEEGIQLATSDPDYEGALIFDQNCAGCHSLEAAGSHGSAIGVGSREYKDGPNFNERVESVEDVLYAIRNGGYSSGPMPQNIVTGEEAQKVAEFVAKYSGRGRGDQPAAPQSGAPEGTD